MSWFYGLVMQEDGKKRIWEIYEEEKFLWGHPGVFSWMIRDINMLIKDLYYQWRYRGKLFPEELLQKGNEKQFKKWSKEIKKAKEKINCDIL